MLILLLDRTLRNGGSSAAVNISITSRYGSNLGTPFTHPGS
jgi:hypothetical protein